jgi:hypothetical protein
MSSPTTYYIDNQEPETPRTPKATRLSRSRDDELLKAPRKHKKPAAKVSFKSLELASLPAPLATPPTSSTTNLSTVRTNSREFRRSVSPAPANDTPAVVVAKPRERQLDHWVKFHKVSLGRARTAKMNNNEVAAASESDE